jgi:hypothetical protein
MTVDSAAISTARRLKPLSDSIGTAVEVAGTERLLRERGALWRFALDWRTRHDTSKAVEQVGAALVMASFRGLVRGGPVDLVIAPEVARTASGREQLWSLLSFTSSDCAEIGCPLSIIGTFVDAIESQGVSDSNTARYLRSAFCRLVEVYSDTVSRRGYHDASEAEAETLGAIVLAARVLRDLSGSTVSSNSEFARDALRVAGGSGTFGKAIVEEYASQTSR